MNYIKKRSKIVKIGIACALLVYLNPIVLFGQDKPNIVWIVSEDNAAEHLKLYGGPVEAPHIEALAAEGILFENAICTAPVCAPSRNTLITGMYPTTLGTENMRSEYPIPDFIHFFPYYLRQAGYYTSNNSKKDYNTVDQPDVWNESSNTASYDKRGKGQPFFAVFNIFDSHESSIFRDRSLIEDDILNVSLPPYLPNKPAIKKDFASYYKVLQDMDRKVGEIISSLKEEGLWDNTIVFYYGDNGGVLPRSKRFMYESGLRIPLVVRVPEKYHALVSNPSEKTNTAPLSFVDFAPTVLGLAGIEAPDYFQGKSFLDVENSTDHEYSFAFRGRMDERVDMARAVRGKGFLYVRHFYPRKPYGSHIDFLWRAKSMQAWEDAFKDGELDSIQSAFWRAKPLEELFDLRADPHNIQNLATEEEYKSVLTEMRQALKDWAVNTKDAGFIPEPTREKVVSEATLYDYVRKDGYDLERVIETAYLATQLDPSLLNEFIVRLNDQHAEVRYWALNGISNLRNGAKNVSEKIIPLLNDQDPSVQIAAAEALYYSGKKDIAIQTLADIAQGDNLMASVYALNVFDGFEPTDLHSITDKLEQLQELTQGKRPDFQARLLTDLLKKANK